MRSRVSDFWVSCEWVIVVLLNNLFLQLGIWWNVEESFPVNQIILFVPRGVLEF